MKTASMVLGIIGGVMTFLFSAFVLLTSFLFGQLDKLYVFDFHMYDPSMSLAVIGIVGIIVSAVGIVGGAIVTKQRIASGIMLSVAALVSFISIIGILTGILFTIAAVFAFIQEKSGDVYGGNNQTLPPRN